MFFYIFLCIANLFLALEAKNSDKKKSISNKFLFWQAKNSNCIKSIEDLNNIGVLEWGRDILNSNKKKQEIVDLFKNAKINEVLREEMVNNISGGVLNNWLHSKVNSKNAAIISAYADFRDSLSDEQLSHLNWKMYIYLGKLIGTCSAAYIALLGLLAYAELKTQQAEKKFSFAAV